MIDYLKIIGEFYPDMNVSVDNNDPCAFKNIMFTDKVTTVEQVLLDQLAALSTRELIMRLEPFVDGAMLSVVNNTDSIFVVGTPVYATGLDSTSGRVTINSATTNTISSLNTIGIVLSDINPGSSGVIITSGVITNIINTTQYKVGDILYVGDGNITNSKPDRASHYQQIGTVLSNIENTSAILINIQGAVNQLTQRSIDIPIYGTSSQVYRSSAVVAFTAVSRFMYRGSALSTPVAIKTVSWISNSAQKGTIRIVNTATGLVVAISPTFNNTTPGIITLSNIANIPLIDAIFEIQVSSSVSTNTVYTSSAHIYF